MASDKRPEARRKARLRLWRECTAYGCALVMFLAFLYYVMREPAP